MNGDLAVMQRLLETQAHLEIIAKRLERFARHVVVLRGGQSEKQRRDVAARLAAIPQAEERVIVATGRYLGEGFDDSRLDTLFLTMPIAWKGMLAQYAGRLHRLNDAKREVIIYDYADMRVPVLGIAKTLCRGAVLRGHFGTAVQYRAWSK
jgi:superfamily II DNA or RNA helicase